MRLGFMVLQAMNTFLLSNGLDILSRVRDLQAAWHPYILRVLKVTKPDNRLHEAAITYLRIQLQLGAFQVWLFCQLCKDIVHRVASSSARHMTTP